MREIRPSGSEGGVASNRHPYPYRLKLAFPTFWGSKYQVLFLHSATQPGTVVPFATTPDGAATTTVFTGNGSPANLFVDRTATSGFYRIAIQVTAG